MLMKPHLTGNLLTVFQFKIGARVMKTTNIDVSDGLTNSAMGTVTNVTKTVNGHEQVHVILVKFDSVKVGADAITSSNYSLIDASSVPIHKVIATLKIKDRVTGCISHTQFPLILACAVTIHKCQGLTLPEIVLDMSQESVAITVAIHMSLSAELLH